MLDSLREQLYPCLLVTKMEIFKVALVTNPVDHQKKLLNFLQIPDIDTQSLWEYARNIIWTYNTFAARCMLDEKPAEAMKIFRIGMKLLDLKDPAVDWSTRDEWKLLKIIFMRNMAYFYCKFINYEQAIAQLLEVEKMQNTVSKEMRYKIDTDSPFLVLSYLHLVGNNIKKAEEYSKIIADQAEEPHVFRRPEFMEPSLVIKKEGALKTISNFILGKCHIHKKEYREALERYRQGVAHLKSCDMFDQTFKNAILEDCNLIRNKLKESKKPALPQLASEDSKQNETVKTENNENYPEIKLPKNYSHRALKVQANRSDSNIQFHSPPARLSFGVDAQVQSAAALSKVVPVGKGKSTARFNKSTDKVESAISLDSQGLDHTKGLLSVKNTPKLKPTVPEQRKPIKLEIKNNNFFDILNPRPQTGTFRRTPSIASDILAPNSATSRKNFISKNSLNYDSKLGENTDHHKNAYSSHGYVTKLPSLVDKNEGAKSFARGDESDIKDLVELMDYLEERGSSRASIKVHESETLTLEGTKFESIATGMNSLSSMDFIADLKKEDKSTFNAKEFTLNIFKRISNKERESDTIKNGLPTSKKFFEEKPGSQEERNKDEPALNLKELKLQIREAEKLCASRIQRWWRKMAKTLPLKLDKYAISNNYNNKERDNNNANANYRSRRPVNNLTISNHTLTVTQSGSSKEESHSRQTPPPTTIPTLQPSKGVDKNFRLTANAILINDNYIDSQPEVIPERSDRSFAPELLTPSPLLPIARVSLASPHLLPTGRTDNFARMSSRDFSLLANPVPSVREPKTPISRIDKLEDQKAPTMEISDGASSLRSKNQKRSQRKYRPGFKDNSSNETQLNQQSYIRSRTSIRSKSITEKSLLLKYDPSKLPEEINKGIKFRIMRKYAEIKESQHIWLRFNKAFMSKDEVWFFRYNGNSWDYKNKEKKDLVLNLQLCNTSRQSAEMKIPFFYTEEVQTDKSVTVWPIIFPSIKNWFLAQNFEDEYEQFSMKQLQNFPKRMYRRIEKALSHRGFKPSPGRTKLTSDDKKIFQEIQKRLIFLIEKKIIKVSKINGESLIVGKSSFGEKLQAINRRQVEKEQAIKDNSKIIEVGQSLPTYESEKTEDRIFYPPPPGTLTDLLEVEKRCLNERIEELKEREIKRAEKRMTSDRKRVTFMEEYDLKDVKYASYNFLSSTIVFRSIFKLKNFYWLYITSKVIGINHKGQARRNIEIIVEPGTIKSLASKRRGDSRNSYKTFNFGEGEFMEKCMDFLEISGIKLQSLYRMKHYFKFELEKRLNKLIVEQGDRIKLSSKFQNIEEQDDPFAKASAYYRLTEKSVFQDFNFDKSVFASTDNDHLFEKNFKEIYGKHFINEAQKFFNHKSYNDEDDKEQPPDIMDENDQDMIYKQRYIDDDEVLVGGNKPEVDVLDSTIILAENSEPCRRYFTYKYQGTVCYIRLICDTDLSGKNYIEISYYHPNRGQLNYANISEKKLLKKIRSILGRSSKVIQLRLLQSLIEYGISSVGRVLHVKSTSYDVNLIQRKYAIPVNPAYLKIDMLNQSSNLESAFEIWTLNFMHKFDDALGRCYVKLLVYRKKVLIMTDNITPDMNLYHFSFEINPEKSKTRQYRLLLNSYDLKSYLNIKIEGDSSFYFTKLSRSVLEKFILWKRPTSKVLALPIIRTNQEIPDNPSLYVFYNTFSINSFETKMKITNYLEPKNYAPKIIYQGVRKFGKHFYIVTIEYVHRFDYWNILIYNPRTSRNFVTIIFFEEILSWKNSFLKKIYPSFLNEFKKHNFKNYQQFTTTYVRHFKKVKKASEVKFTSTVDIPSSKRGPISAAEFEGLNKKERQLFFKIDRVYSLPFLRRKKNQSRNISSRHHTDESREDPLNNNDFYEFKFWESVVKNLEFAEDPSGRDIVKIDNFEGKLSELIFVSAIQIDKSVDCLVEIHIENNHENKFLNSPFENITYLSSIHNILYIKIFFFNLVICQREQLYLREIINLYIADGIYKYQANYIDSKLNLADLQNICGYIIHKIQSSNLLTLLNESPLFSKRFSIQQKSEYRIKIKTNAQTDADDNMEEKKGIFLFRKVIMTHPMISASVYFDKYRSIFMVYLYRFEDCAMVIKEYKMKSVKKKVPLAQNMMEAGHYPLVGKLILDKNINFLKIYASYTFNILELFKK